MKKQKGKSEALTLVLIGFFLLVLILGLIFAFVGGSFLDTKGEVVEEAREIGDFKNVELRDSGSLHVTQNPEASLKIEAKESSLDDIRTEVVDDTLIIDYKKADFMFWPFMKKNQRNYYLSVPDLSRVMLSSSGKITFETFQTERLELSIDGSGKISIPVVAKDVKVTIDGSGTMDVLGTVENQEVTISGSGSYDSYNLENLNAKAVVNGSGIAKMKVAGKLDASISGSGTIRYKGDPELTSNVSGSGTIKRVSD